MFETINNVKWYNSDYYYYKQKYNYDYILGNPPFNLRTQIYKRKNKTKTENSKLVKVDTVLYDIDFVSKAYSDLNLGGILCFIISDRFTRQDTGKFKIFKSYLEKLKKVNKDFVDIASVSSFREDDKITKNMTTSYGMVIIKLVKIDRFNFNLNAKNDELDNEEEEEIKFDDIEKPPPKPKITKPKNIIQTPKRPKYTELEKLEKEIEELMNE